MSARQGRVHRRGRALLALCAAVLSSWWPTARADRLDDDLDAVWESAWDQQGTATRLTRWERPVRWRLAGTDATHHHKTVSQAMAAVAQGSGRDIAEAPAGAAEANLTFEVVAEERLADSIGCETQITQSVWAIVEARVAMRESQVWECAYHEAMHAMGVPGHPAGKTVLSYFPWRSDKLLDLDRLLLATWYDPALSRGDTVFDVLRVGGQRAIRQPEIGIAPEAAELRRRDHFARRVGEMERFARGDGDVPMIIRRSGRASPGHIEDSRNLMAYFLGLVFAAGHSLTKDEARAAAWFEKAARRKYFPAQLELARLLARGAGAAPDVVEAYRWFTSAARAGSCAAERERAQLEKRMDEAQGRSADREGARARSVLMARPRRFNISRSAAPAAVPKSVSKMAGVLQQRTLKAITRAVGLGVHGGQKVELTFKPAPPDAGVTFRRVDLPQPVSIPVNADSVCDTRMATTISPGGDPGAPKVQTIEHLLSACAGLGLDNLAIDINGEEVPVLDGSAASFVYLLQSAGIALQDAPKRFIRVKKTVEIREGEGAALKWARLEPHHGYVLTFEIEFDHPAVNATGQRVSFDMGSGRYKRDIARARTFGFSRDVETMRAHGLGLGGSMDNVIVLGDTRVLNEGGLRYDDEFAKHKILDAIGDLHVAGRPMLAHYTAYKSGHALNNKLLRLLLADRDAYDVVTFDDAKQAPAGFAELAPAW